MLTDPKWKYRNAETSRKPGYLAKRFAQIRAEQREADRKAADAAHERIIKVRAIGSGK